MLISAILLLGLLSLSVAEFRDVKHATVIEFPALNCRKHSAVLTGFGGVGDGKTSNTEVFKAAIANLSHLAADGGAQLVVPPGKWLTGSFNLTSHFTLFIHKDAIILGARDETEWPLLPVLPSYGRGRDAPGGRFSSLIFGTNLTDVIITERQSNLRKMINCFRLSEIILLISNLTLINSPSWNVHPIYSSDIIIQYLTIIAPVDSPNTHGIDPDSCTNTRIEDSFVVSGDDCIAVKSGWDQYGIRFNMSTKHLVIRRFTCISPDSATIALGSEMSGGIEDVRAENITAINTESGVRIKTAVGRGDPGFNPKALPKIKGINYKDIVADNVTYSARLEGIKNDPFTDICISNVDIKLTAKPKELQWNCTDVQGVTNKVTPDACNLLPEKEIDCTFPEERLPIEDVKLKTCSISDNI
ncbi:hypothetical protein V6N12_021746 [Hibiscus sabdariffa]|uniref:Polygalacturonase n=1 Tax=Hibiscus sabdariffa TaxID=183260 RepID=A0ABR2FSX6_9ROSI